MALAFTTLYLVTNYTTVEAFYWYDGVAFYTVALLPFVIVLESVVKLLGDTPLSPLRLFLTAIALVFASLTHELFAIVFMIVFMTAGYVLSRRKLRYSDSRLITSIFFLCIAILCFCIIALAPGSLARASHGGVAHTLPGLLISTGMGLIITPVIFLENLNIGVLLFATYVLFQQRNRVTVNRHTGIEFIWTALLCTLPLTMVFGILATQVSLPGRALNLIYFFTIIGMTGLAGWYIQTKGYPRWGSLNLLPELAAQYLFIAMALVIIFDRDSVRAVQDALIEGSKYAHAMQDRIERLEGTTDDVILPELPTGSRLLMFLEYGHRPDKYQNICAARYFGKRSVRLALPQTQ